MEKYIRRIIMAVSVLLFAGAVLVYAGIQEEAEARDSMQFAENGDKNDGSKTSEESFYEKAEKKGISHEESKEYWERFLKDNVFRDGSMELTGFAIEDMDGNGEKDLLVMVLDKGKAMDYGSYGCGCLWIYMNEDEPYSFDEEDCPYLGCFDYFAEDIDNDGNVEIAFSSQGTGCGAAGDSYKAIFKYRDHAIEEMELPSDLEWDYDCGIRVSVYQEAEENRYSAHCPYFGETVYFSAENTFGPKEASREAGSNVRGFFNLCPVKYKGKNALQASEYLNGEGGIVHCVGVAYFIILWDENGKAYVDQWWVEGDVNQYVNHKGSCIAYADGEAVYFVNLSDDRAIYRVNPDGSGMEKLCDASGDQMQVSGEYIYFCTPYEKEYDIHGLFSEAEVNSHQGGYLCRMKKDGSGKELLMADAEGFTLAAADGSDVMYDGNIYCGYCRRRGRA